MKRLDLKGKIFGRLTVLDFAYVKNEKTFWSTECECKQLKIVAGGKLTSGHTKSCGCLNREAIKESNKKNKTKHNMSYSSEYWAWHSMKRRCLLVTDSHYPNYGGRGVTIDDSWIKSFIPFINYMGIKPSPQHSLDRIDNNGNYEPGNCRWATSKEQTRNQRNNVFLDTEYGKMIISDACKKYNVSHSLICWRVRRHKITHQDAFQELVLESGRW